MQSILFTGDTHPARDIPESFRSRVALSLRDAGVAPLIETGDYAEEVYQLCWANLCEDADHSEIAELLNSETGLTYTAGIYSDAEDAESGDFLTVVFPEDPNTRLKIGSQLVIKAPSVACEATLYKRHEIEMLNCQPIQFPCAAFSNPGLFLMTATVPLTIGYMFRIEHYNSNLEAGVNTKLLVDKNNPYRLAQYLVPTGENH